MSDKFKSLEEKHIDFISKQNMFFVSTYSQNGHINLSPKGANTFKVINKSQILWLNLTGSGNETSAHIQENSKMTIMFCSFDKTPIILKLYGKAKVIHESDKQWKKYLSYFESFIGTRQFFALDIDLVVTSCGYGVPYYEFKGERDTLSKWSENKNRDEIREYWKEKNSISLDGENIKIP